MRRPNFLVMAAMVAMSPSITAAQDVVTIGPDPGAPSSLQNLYTDHNRAYQSFVSPANALMLRSFSFWWTGSPLADDVYFVRAGVSRSESELPPALFSDAGNLDKGSPGWYTIEYNMPVVGSEELFFHMLMGNGGGEYPPDFTVNDFAQVQVTDADAIAGTFWSDASGTAEGDMLFRAEYTVTPEPVTLLLLGSGLAGVGGAAARRRKRKA